MCSNRGLFPRRFFLHDATCALSISGYTLWNVLGLINRDRRQEFGGEWLTDVHFGIRIFRKTEWTVDANNLFNVYLDNNIFNNVFGTQWKDTVGPPFAPVVDSDG